MANHLGGAIIGLLDSERIELRAAAATVLVAVGKGDKAVEAALIDRLGDSDAVVRGIALDGLADMGTTGIAPRLVALLRGDDEQLAERARQLLEIAHPLDIRQPCRQQDIVRYRQIRQQAAGLRHIADEPAPQHRQRLIRAPLLKGADIDRMAICTE